MRETTLRWGLGMGAAGTALGIVALLVGTIFIPSGQYADATAIATAIFIRGLLVLVSLGVALALAYYGGQRGVASEAEALDADQPGSAPGKPALQSPIVTRSRVEAAIAGAIALFCYWFITTLYLYVLQPSDSRVAVLPFLVSRGIFGILCILMGAGMGGLGARAAWTRRLLTRGVIRPAAATPSETASTAIAPLEGTTDGATPAAE